MLRSKQNRAVCRAPLATSPGVLGVLLRELADARAIDAARDAVETVRRRVLGSGAFDNFDISGEPSLTSSGQIRPDAADLLVRLKERRKYTFNMGVSQTLSGKVEGVRADPPTMISLPTTYAAIGCLTCRMNFFAAALIVAGHRAVYLQRAWPGRDHQTVHVSRIGRR